MRVCRMKVCRLRCERLVFVGMMFWETLAVRRAVVVSDD